MSNDRKEYREPKSAASEVSSQPSQRRRRLVKGALSAPVFLTLQSGSVLANSSIDATVATANDAVNNPPFCIFPGLNTTLEFESGTNKADFGEGAECISYTGAVGTDSDGRLRCPDTTGGYIVTASSAGSLCPT